MSNGIGLDRLRALRTPEKVLFIRFHGHLGNRDMLQKRLRLFLFVLFIRNVIKSFYYHLANQYKTFFGHGKRDKMLYGLILSFRWSYS